MATTTSITTTYAGEFAGKYVSAALLSADTLEGGGITIKPNVKYKEVLKTMNLDAITADATCDFSDTSTLTLAEKILTPKELQVNLELCKSDFVSDWEAISMGYSAFDELPSNFADYLIGYVASKVAAKNETNIWAGADANAGEYDGFTALLAADASVVDVVGTTINAANVIVEMGKVVDAQGTTWFNGGDLAFDGVKIFVASGMPTNDMVAAQKSNLFFGTGLLSDQQEVKLLDMADLDGSQNVRVVMRFTAGVQIGIGADIVYYT